MHSRCKTQVLKKLDTAAISDAFHDGEEAYARGQTHAVHRQVQGSSNVATFVQFAMKVHDSTAAQREDASARVVDWTILSCI